MKNSLMIKLLLICVVACSGCASSQPKQKPSATIKSECPTLSPPPASVMKPVKSDFRQRLESQLLESAPKQTTSQTNSEKPKK